MSGPASAGLFIYAKLADRLALFYMEVLGMRLQQHTAEMMVLQAPGLELVLHAIPEAIARHITITEPPQPRENVALKFFASVNSFAAVRPLVVAHGGQLWEQSWQGPGFRVCNAMDPEGNMFQLREPLPA
jgi:predicted enzyme related to lactoylglutathione lyase